MKVERHEGWSVEMESYTQIYNPPPPQKKKAEGTRQLVWNYLCIFTCSREICKG